MRKIKKGDIYYADLNSVIGSEQGGLRPVVIIQNNIGNQFSPTLIIAPITKIIKKENLPTHILLNSSCLKYKSIVLLEQIRTIDITRLQNYLGKLDVNELKKIDKALIRELSIDINSLLK